jgi:uncharacterized membrane protein YdfJ with MMPL/SSD domain
MTSDVSRRWVRPLIGLVLTLLWLAVAGIGGPYFGRIGEVATNDQSLYLPSSAESTQVQKRLTDFYAGETIPAVVVVVLRTAPWIPSVPKGRSKGSPVSMSTSTKSLMITVVG